MALAPSNLRWIEVDLAVFCRGGPMSALPRRPVLAPPRTKLARPLIFLRSVPRSTRNMGSIRFRRKSNEINDLIFSTRNKVGGRGFVFVGSPFAFAFVGALRLLRPRRPPLASPRTNPSAAFDFSSLCPWRSFSEKHASFSRLEFWNLELRGWKLDRRRRGILGRRSANCGPNREMLPLPAFAPGDFICSS